MSGIKNYGSYGSSYGSTPKMDSQTKKNIRNLQNKSDSIENKLGKIDSLGQVERLSVSDRVILSPDATTIKHVRIQGRLSRDIESLNVNALNRDGKSGFKFNGTTQLQIGGQDVQTLKVDIGGAQQDIALGAGKTLQELIVALQAAGVITDPGTSTTKAGITTISGLKFADNVKILSYDPVGGGGTTDLNMTPTQFLNSVGMESLNSVTIKDGVLKADGTYLIQPETKIGLEPDNKFKLPGFDNVTFQATKSGDFDITSGNVIDSITNLLSQYNAVLSTANQVSKIAGYSMNNGIGFDLGYKNIDYLSSTGATQKNAAQFGISFGANGVVIDENKFQQAVSEDYVGAVNFFNSLVDKMVDNQKVVSKNVEEYKQKMTKDQEEIQARIDNIIQKSEEASQKFEEMQQKLMEMQMEFERQMDQLNSLFNGN